MRNTIKVFIRIAVIATLVALAYLVFEPYFKLSFVQSKLGILKAFVTDNFLLSALLFVLTFIVTASLTMPVMTMMTLLCGFLFDLPVAIVLMTLAFVGHCALMFVLTRLFFRELVMQKFGSAIAPINKKIDERGLYYLLFLRVSIIVPPWLINVACAVTSMRFLHFILLSLIASTPMLTMVLITGGLLGDIQSISEIYSPKIVLMALSLIALSLIPLLLPKKKI